MTLGLIGKKIGMTREFFDSGTSVPVTVIKIEKGRVIDIYSKEKNGYSSVKLGFMKIKSSLKSVKKRDQNSKLVRIRGRVYVINKTNRRFKARQG